MVSVTAQYTWRQISSSGLLARTALRSGSDWSELKFPGVRAGRRLNRSIRSVPLSVFERRRRVMGRVMSADRRLNARSCKSKQWLDGHLGNVGLSHSPCWPS